MILSYHPHQKQRVAITIAFFSLFTKYSLLRPIGLYVSAFTPPIIIGGGLNNNNNWKVVVLRSASENTVPVEVVADDDDDDIDDAWLTDKERAERRRKAQWKPAAADQSPSTTKTKSKTKSKSNTKTKTKAATSNNDETDNPELKKRLTYTAEEEELIETLGGKDLNNPSPKREPGFLGDSTLKEIAFDYQIPICYLADVICGWGVQAPIDPDALLGDMITGEQAFAILEAIHTLDIGALNDRYGDYDLQGVCNEFDIDLMDGFELAVKEGWNLPFGVRTFLRVEQEDDLIRILAKDDYNY